MNWITPTIAAFGESVGITGLSLDVSGQVSLDMDPGGTLTIQQLPEHESQDLLVTLRRPVPLDGGVLRAALLAVDFRCASTAQAQVSVSGDQLVFTLRLPRNSFILHTLEESIEELLRLHEAALS